MPYIIEKLSNGKYRVLNALTGKVFSKGTTLIRAKSQLRYLHFVNSVQKANMNPDWEKLYKTR
jgi:hypothetical protein